MNNPYRSDYEALLETNTALGEELQEAREKLAELETKMSQKQQVGTERWFRRWFGTENLLQTIIMFAGLVCLCGGTANILYKTGETQSESASHGTAVLIVEQHKLNKRRATACLDGGWRGAVAVVSIALDNSTTPATLHCTLLKRTGEKENIIVQDVGPEY